MTVNRQQLHPTATLPHWANAIRARRNDLGQSQQSIVNASDGRLYQSELSRIERGLIHPTRDLGLEKFLALLKALGWSLDAFSHATGVTLPFTSEAQAEAVAAVSRLEVHPDWLKFPVFGSVSAGKSDTGPVMDEAYIPREKLRARGTNPEHVRVYLVNGDCMISGEAQRVEKNIAPKDYVAVDIHRRPQAGDVVVAWWPKEEKMVVKRYKVEGHDIVLYPANPGHPNLVLGSEDDVYVIGSVVWRGG